MQSVLGEPVVASWVDFNGDIDVYGARIEGPFPLTPSAIATAWTPAHRGLVENDEDPLFWYVSMESPVTAGDYIIRWQDELGANQFVMPLSLATVAVGSGDWEVVDRDDIRPTVDQVAILEHTRTVDAAGNDQHTFTDTTRPTADETEVLIDLAVNFVLGQLPTDKFSPDHFPDTTDAIALQAAILVEGSYFREKLDSGSADLYTRMLQSSIISLNQKITADARIGSGLSDGKAIIRIC